MRPCSTHEISRLRGNTLVHQLDDLVRRCEVQLPGQRSLQVLLEELAMSANAALEVPGRRRVPPRRGRFSGPLLGVKGLLTYPGLNSLRYM
jgi:hypothetical protein